MFQETKSSSIMIETLVKYFWKKGKLTAINAKDMVGDIAILWNLNMILLHNFFAIEISLIAQFYLVILIKCIHHQCIGFASSSGNIQILAESSQLCTSQWKFSLDSKKGFKLYLFLKVKEKEEFADMIKIMKHSTPLSVI